MRSKPVQNFEDRTNSRPRFNHEQLPLLMKKSTKKKGKKRGKGRSIKMAKLSEHRETGVVDRWLVNVIEYVLKCASLP